MYFKVFFSLFLIHVVYFVFFVDRDDAIKLNVKHDQLSNYLIKYKDISKNGGWNSIKSGKAISFGMSDLRVINIKKRLFVTGELTKNSEIITDTFDIALENAVKKFQKNHNIDSTGIADTRTLNELNIPVATRIKQIEANMNRWKNMPTEFEKRYVFVNIASGKLDVIDDDLLILNMKVIVGRNDRRTPVLNTNLTTIEFNPHWFIPPGIMQRDILPKLKKNSGFIESNDMHVFYNNKKIDPSSINWSSVNFDNDGYRVVQSPGSGNPMGAVKFIFPNKYYIFMHDTPNKKLFDATSIGFSSGCVRLSEGVKLSKYLLKVDKDWDSNKIDSLIDTGKNSVISLEKPIRVYLLYFTAWVNNEGELQFARDIYKKDF